MAYSSEQIAFIQKIAPLVQAECKKRGYPFASPILAQASVESFTKGTLSSLAKKYNNFFGMKCGSAWKGKSVNMTTGEEYTVGTITTIQANFRAYDSVEEGVAGYFDFIAYSRYANLKNATSPKDYLEKIKADGYATSSTYVNTCMSRITALNLAQYDGEYSIVGRQMKVTASVLNIRKEPSATSRDMGDLPKGAVVTVDKSENGWAHFEGWLSQQYLS